MLLYSCYYYYYYIIECQYYYIFVMYFCNIKESPYFNRSEKSILFAFSYSLTY